MQLLQTERTYDELIQHMRENGYSESYLDQIEKEICWIEKNQKTHHLYLNHGNAQSPTDFH